jgi:serine/threonine protein kinase
MSATTDKPAPDLERVIESDRYRLIQFTDRGCWGAVYEAEDRETGKRVAIKILDPTEVAQSQMEHRNLTPEKAIKKEAVILAPCSNVVPRIFERDKHGKPFIVMPFYGSNMEDVILDKEVRQYLGSGLSLDKILKFASDIANGLAEMHSKLNIRYGDLKPSNLMLDWQGNVLLTDLGASSIGTTLSPRDNIGYEFTRAPECWADDSLPSKQSDVWAFGSLLHRMLTGKYVFEDELKNAKDPNEFFLQLYRDQNIANALIKAKVQHIPKKFRNFLRRCFEMHSVSRYTDGVELKKALDEIIKGHTGWELLKKQAAKLTMAVGLPAILAGLLVYKAATHEPKELTMPDLKSHDTYVHYKTPNYLPTDIERIGLEFERENLDLPEVDLSKKLDGEWNIRMSTKNAYVAYLMKAHELANDSLGHYIATERQHRIFLDYSHSAEHGNAYIRALDKLARCIEVGLVHSKTPTGKIDLEDVCTIARVGPDKVWEARRATNSFEFKEYITAKDKDGNFIIPIEEQQFIKKWLAYIKQ